MESTNPFEVEAPRYGAVRPAYPSPVLDALLNEAEASLEHRAHFVADIGAGTGKMTQLLARRGLSVVALEPSEAMRQHMREDLIQEGFIVLDEDAASAPSTMRQNQGTRGDSETIAVRAASAEATGLADGTLDLVVFAQSWHWVDPVRAAAEAARILSPGGVLAAVWNQMDVSIPWVHRLTRIMRSGDVHRPENRPDFGDAFSRPELKLVTWEEAMTPEQILELGTTRSSYLKQDEAGRRRMQANLRWYLHEHLGRPNGSRILLPYWTLVWTAHRL